MSFRRFLFEKCPADEVDRFGPKKKAGAGNDGTDELVDTYARETPGQSPEGLSRQGKPKYGVKSER